MIQGAIHVHSTYSDGELTLAELREIYVSSGCSFICMNDHAEYFDENRLQAYRHECSMLSDEELQIIAGLEYRCEREMHITAYGVTGLTTLTDPQQVIRFIAGHDALAVIAHPKDEFFPWIESFETLPHGIETWNTKYDGRYAPRPGTFGLLQSLRGRNPAMMAFYGQDLHWKNQFRGLFVDVDASSSDPETVLACLRTGKFRGRKGTLELPSDGALSQELLAEFAGTHARSERMWRFVKSGKNVLARLGIHIPESAKSLLRKIF